jgi:protein-tyrosine phosphatase
MMNFREFGACGSRHGGRVRSGYLFRGAAPRTWTEIASEQYGLLGDLRHPVERSDDAAWPAAWRDVLVKIDDSGDGENAPHLSLMDGSTLDKAAVDRFYLGLYRSLPQQKPYMRLFGSILQRMEKNPGKTFIFCAAGKDRTGMLAALIGLILGLSNDDIMQDYLASARDPSLEELVPLVLANLQRTGSGLRDPEVALYILGVQPAYLQAMLDILAEECGGVDNYLDQIGVGPKIRETIREHLIVS